MLTTGESNIPNRTRDQGKVYFLCSLVTIPNTQQSIKLNHNLNRVSYLPVLEFEFRNCFEFTATAEKVMGSGLCVSATAGKVMGSGLHVLATAERQWAVAYVYRPLPIRRWAVAYGETQFSELKLSF